MVLVARQHNWHKELRNKDPGKHNHNVSSTPAHATSLTLTGNDPAYASVKYDYPFDTKWVNFYASANVTYRISSYSLTPTTMSLYIVHPATTWKSAYTNVAYSYRCTEPTWFHSPYSPQTEHVPDVLLTNDPGFCPPAGSDLMFPTITFTPRMSGWYYAQVRSVSGKAIGVIALAPVGIQITPVIPESSGAEVIASEGRMGQSIPISYPPMLDGQRMESRYGKFTERNESHAWRFQSWFIRGYSTPDGSFSEDQPGIILNDVWKLGYDVIVTRYGDSSNLKLNMSVLDGADPSNQSLIEVPGVIHNYTSQGGRREDVWSIDAAALRATPGVSHELNNGDNVYLSLTWEPPRDRQGVEYEIRVVQHSSYTNPRWSIDSNSLESGAVNVRRFCDGDLIERRFDSFNINERIGPHDADHFRIWVQEGEHLNVTYRGEVPAVIDIAGTAEDPDSGMTSSALNELVSGFSGPSRDATWLDITFRQDWRPFLVDEAELMLPFDYHGPTTEEQYFAERGYLWSYAKCSRAQYEMPTSIARLSCSNNDKYNDEGILPYDNTVQLTMTAFITGEYTVRIRGQGDPGSEPTLDGWHNWDHVHQMVGAPYTLSFNIGTESNPRRPHWEYLESADPARVPVCGR
jgi:hypothetical protein